MKRYLMLLFILLICFTMHGKCDSMQQMFEPLADKTLSTFALESIAANKSNTGNSDVLFQAEKEILLLEAFHAASGVEFVSRIGACPDSLQEVIANIPQTVGVNGKARNIWDLQVYNGKLYIGYGSTTQNTGPTELWAFDLATATLSLTCTIGTEAIERFRVWQDTLFIPNSDPKGGDFLKFVYLTDEHTCSIVSLNNHAMAHVRDVYFFKGRYYLVGNTRCPGSKELDCAGLISMTDFGGSFDNTWLQSELLLAEPYANNRWNWFFGLLEVDGELILPNAMFTKAYAPNLLIKNSLFYQLDSLGSFNWSAFQSASKRLRHPHFFPVDTTQNEIVDTAAVYTSLRFFEHATLKGKTLYTLRTYSMFDENYQSAYNNSAGCMLKDSLTSLAKEVHFPANNAIGEDLLIINDQLYVLANEKISADSYKIYVYKTSQPTANAASWTEVLKLDSKNMARSFEYANGYFFFGLGYNQGDKLEDAGELFRVKAIIE